MANNVATHSKPPYKCPPLPSNQILSFIGKCEQIASKNGFLVAYDAKPQLLTQSGMQYSICLAENLAHKPTSTGSSCTNKSGDNKPNSKQMFDPFAGPFKPGAHICDCGTQNEYRLLLNKFPVLPKHVLLVSSDWVPQTHALTAKDLQVALDMFRSMLTDENNQEQSPLMFVNSGMQSGATQMHRHLHFIADCASTALDDIVASHGKDEEKKQSEMDTNAMDQDIQTYKKYAFLHGAVLLDIKSKDLNGDKLHTLYTKLMQYLKDQMKLMDDNGVLSYNLLMNGKCLLMVARKQGVFEADKVTFAVNALPFAGLLFCNSEQQMAMCRKIGLNGILKQCTFSKMV